MKFWVSYDPARRPKRWGSWAFNRHRWSIRMGALCASIKWEEWMTNEHVRWQRIVLWTAGIIATVSIGGRIIGWLWT